MTTPEADYKGTLGRYALYGEIASGGMATVHFGRLLGPVGFARTVAIKRLHPHLAKDPEFVRMFLEEARLAARIRHPNVVTTLDVVALENELFLVMEYVQGDSFSRLVRKTGKADARVPVRHAVSVVCGALEGLHAAHEAKSERGLPLGVVHRDVSPQNILVGTDGVARVLDFGVAKATNKVSETRTDQIKGKVAYMAPEQLARGNIDRRTDVYSASVVLWEALAGRRLFQGEDVTSLVYSVVTEKVGPPSEFNPEVPGAIDDIVMRGLARDIDARWATARDMAVALEGACPLPSAREVGAWVEETSSDALTWRAHVVSQIESHTSASAPPPRSPEATASGEMLSGPGTLPSSPSGKETPPPSGTTGPSQVTYMASAGPTPAVAPPRSRAPFVGAAAAALVVGALGALGIRALLARGPATPSIARAADTSVAPPAPPAATEETAIVLARPPSTGAPADSASAAPASAPEATSAAPSRHAGTVVARGATPAAHVAAHSTASPPPTTAPPPPQQTATDCDNPFTVDADGIRRPKPQCFKH